MSGTAEKKKRRECGAPEQIRTADLLLRRQTLYPAELRARVTSFYRTLQSSGSLGIAIVLAGGYESASKSS